METSSVTSSEQLCKLCPVRHSLNRLNKVTLEKGLNESEDRNWADNTSMTVPMRILCGCRVLGKTAYL